MVNTWDVRRFFLLRLLDMYKYSPLIALTFLDKSIMGGWIPPLYSHCNIYNDEDDILA